MSWLIRSMPSSFADEQLSYQLASLSTLPVNLPTSNAFNPSLHEHTSKPSPRLQNALHELSSDRPIAKERLVEILESLAHAPPPAPTPGRGDYRGYVVESDLDRIIETEVLTRAVMVLWKEVLQSYVDGALKLDDDRAWWDATLSSRSGIMMYLVQSELPFAIVGKTERLTSAFSYASPHLSHLTPSLQFYDSKSSRHPVSLAYLPLQAPAIHHCRCAHVHHVAVHSHSTGDAGIAQRASASER